MATTPGNPCAVRILADDLTGALDAAAPFATFGQPVGVQWDAARLLVGDASVALDAGTRELDDLAAVKAVRNAAQLLWTARRGLAFKKVDSVWRGHTTLEVAAAAQAVGFDRIVVAPAFPEQGRVTRDGGQWVREDEGWRCVAHDIAAQLRHLGVDAAKERAATAATAAIVCDAATAEALRAIVERYRGDGARTLWCGTGGLARALARPCAPVSAVSGPRARAGARGGRPGSSAAAPRGRRSAPLVVVVGTAHPVAVRQAEALAAREDVACVDIDPVGDRVNVTGGPLAGAGVVLVRFAFDRPTPAPDAQAYIGAALHAQVRELPMPRCVIVTGGATVRALGDALGATRIDVQGEHEPGIPIARWADGAWAHVPLVTKSGGFGGPDLLIRLSASYARSPLEEA